jgi:antitoxin HigA-1
MTVMERTPPPAHEGVVRLPNIHPGDVLREDFLGPMGISAYRLAKDTGMSQTQVGEILRGARSVTAATALRLSAYFGTSAKLWLNLQAAYDLEEVTEKIKDELAAIPPAPRPEGDAP